VGWVEYGAGIDVVQGYMHPGYFLCLAHAVLDCEGGPTPLTAVLVTLGWKATASRAEKNTI